METKGFDTCADPTVSQMRDFFEGTPYYYTGVYLGGSNLGCPNSVPNDVWVADVENIGYGFLPIWVGKQAPCDSFSNTFSWDPPTARSEGHDNATNAIQAGRDRGFLAGSVLYFDLEGPTSGNSACRDAAQAFIGGWTNEMQDHGRKAGVYGSSCGSSMDDFWSITNRPDEVWLAQWNGNPSVYAVSCVPNSHWTGDRFHQYVGNVNVTRNGTTLNVDKDCARGKVASDYNYTYSDPDCS